MRYLEICIFDSMCAIEYAIIFLYVKVVFLINDETYSYYC